MSSSDFDWDAVLSGPVTEPPTDEDLATFGKPLRDVEDVPLPGDEIQLSAAVIDLRAAGALLEELGGNPGKLAETTASMKETLLSVVRERADVRKRARGEEAPTSSTDVRLDAVGAANDTDALAGIAGAFTAAANEAKGIAGDLLDELPGRGGKPRASLKVADGNGFELTVTRSKRTELSVMHDEIDNVLAAALLVGQEHAEASSYVAGGRAAIAALRGLLASSPTYRSTALEALAKRLENADEDALAKRLRKAYGKVEKGEPSVKLERKPIESKGDDA